MRQALWIWIWRVLLAGAIAMLWVGGACWIVGEWPAPLWVEVLCSAGALLLACWAIAPPVPDDYPHGDELSGWLDDELRRRPPGSYGGFPHGD